MANKKMIQPGEFTQPEPNPKNPPPPEAMAELNRFFELAQIKPEVKILADGVLLQFNMLTEFTLMTSKGARQVARKLLEKADELDNRLAANAAKEKPVDG